MPMGEPRDVRAAGAVVTRKGGEVLLVHRPKYDDWSFPKGKLDPGEHEVTAAVREVAEETGLDVRLGPALAPQRYRMSNGRWKHVDYWTARVARQRRRQRLPAQRRDRRRRVGAVEGRDDPADLPPRPRDPRRGAPAATAYPRARRAAARQGALARGLAQGRPAAPAGPARRAPGRAAGPAARRLRRDLGAHLVERALRADRAAVRRHDRLADQALRRAQRGGRDASRASSSSSTRCSTASRGRRAVHPPAGAADRDRRARAAPTSSSSPGAMLVVHHRKGTVVATEVRQP